MAQQTFFNFRIDEQLKKDMESVCSELGLNMTTAFTMFAKKVVREKRIPFDVSIDPFYSEANIAYLERITKEIEEGGTVLQEHQLLEE